MTGMTGIMLTGFAISILSNNLSIYSQRISQQQHAQHMVNKRTFGDNFGGAVLELSNSKDDDQDQTLAPPTSDTTIQRHDSNHVNNTDVVFAPRVIRRDTKIKQSKDGIIMNIYTWNGTNTAPGAGGNPSRAHSHGDKNSGHSHGDKNSGQSHGDKNSSHSHGDKKSGQSVAPGSTPVTAHGNVDQPESFSNWNTSLIP